jgi:hypothetical protein
MTNDRVPSTEDLPMTDEMTQDNYYDIEDRIDRIKLQAGLGAIVFFLAALFFIGNSGFNLYTILTLLLMAGGIAFAVFRHIRQLRDSVQALTFRRTVGPVKVTPVYHSSEDDAPSEYRVRLWDREFRSREEIPSLPWATVDYVPSTGVVLEIRDADGKLAWPEDPPY